MSPAPADGVSTAGQSFSGGKVIDIWTFLTREVGGGGQKYPDALLMSILLRQSEVWSASFSGSSPHPAVRCLARDLR